MMRSDKFNISKSQFFLLILNTNVMEYASEKHILTLVGSVITRYHRTRKSVCYHYHFQALIYASQSACLAVLDVYFSRPSREALHFRVSLYDACRQ